MKCESCGRRAVGYTLDDVPLCRKCGEGLGREEAEKIRALAKARAEAGRK